MSVVYYKIAGKSIKKKRNMQIFVRKISDIKTFCDYQKIFYYFMI